MITKYLLIERTLLSTFFLVNAKRATSAPRPIGPPTNHEVRIWLYTVKIGVLIYCSVLNTILIFEIIGFSLLLTNLYTRPNSINSPLYSILIQLLLRIMPCLLAFFDIINYI